MYVILFGVTLIRQKNVTHFYKHTDAMDAVIN